MISTKQINPRSLSKNKQSNLKKAKFLPKLEKGLDQYIFDKAFKFGSSLKFILTFSSLFLLIIIGLIIQNFYLSGYYQKLEPVPGGIYNEGILGTFTTANPIFATSDIDTSVSKLIFSGLFKYNSNNQLVGDLASSYSVNSRGDQYTVILKPHLTWQDGVPLTARDVQFTFQTIQDPNSQSPLFSSWQGITISIVGNNKIIFKLPDPLASFPEELTTGILPYHILKSVPASNIRSSLFNTSDPVGSGPFSWQSIAVNGNSPLTAEEQITLKPFSKYVWGKPKLAAFIVNAYADSKELLNSFNSGSLNSIEGLSQIPNKFKNQKSVIIHNLILTAGVYSFFKTTSGVLADKQVRLALVQGANVPAIIQKLGYPTRAVVEPLLQGQLGYNPIYSEPAYDIKAAQVTLTNDGWILAKNGYRYKNNQLLSFNLTLLNNPEYQKVANQLQYQWKQLGVQVNLQVLDQLDMSSVLLSHQYDALLYGIEIGVDPDVFVYWDSQQASIQSQTRLNFSEYSNPTADESLEEGRTRLNPALRTIKYQGFLSAWQSDLPALGLYQPRDLYITRGQLYNLNKNIINTTSGRLDNVANWEINQALVTDK